MNGNIRGKGKGTKLKRKLTAGNKDGPLHQKELRVEPNMENEDRGNLNNINASVAEAIVVAIPEAMAAAIPEIAKQVVTKLSPELGSFPRFSKGSEKEIEDDHQFVLETIQHLVNTLTGKDGSEGLMTPYPPPHFGD